MATTIKDIAKVVGVSYMTVSRALNDSPLVTKETKEKILKVAKELHYTPNYNARSLVLKKSYNIGLFFTSLIEGTSPQFFHNVVANVSDAVQESYNLVVRGIHDNLQSDRVNPRHFDGIIVLTQSQKDDGFIQAIKDMGIPLVCLNRSVNGVSSVYCDDEKGGYLCMRHLLDKCHASIAVIEGSKGSYSCVTRRKGVLKALDEAGVVLQEKDIVNGDYSHKGGYEAMQKLLSREKVPRAVCCYNDDMAIGAMSAIHERGLRVPEDIAVSGFDDSVSAPYSMPALTTVCRPMGQISKNGVKILLSSIEEKNEDVSNVIIEPELIIRKST